MNVTVYLGWLDQGDDVRHIVGDLTDDPNPQAALFFGGQATTNSRRGRARSTGSTWPCGPKGGLDTLILAGREQGMHEARTKS
jgi:hypothetical protein